MGEWECKRETGIRKKKGEGREDGEGETDYLTLGTENYFEQYQAVMVLWGANEKGGGGAKGK